jgi:hypothetical protein
VLERLARARQTLLYLAFHASTLQTPRLNSLRAAPLHRRRCGMLSLPLLILPPLLLLLPPRRAPPARLL